MSDAYTNDGTHVFLTSWTCQGKLGPNGIQGLASLVTDPDFTNISSNKNGSIVLHFSGPSAERMELAEKIFDEYRKLRKETKNRLDDFKGLDTREQWASATNSAYNSLYA